MVSLHSTQVSWKGGATDQRTLAAGLRAGDWRLHQSSARAEDSSLTFCTREHFEEFTTPFWQQEATAKHHRIDLVLSKKVTKMAPNP